MRLHISGSWACLRWAHNLPTLAVMMAAMCLSLLLYSAAHAQSKESTPASASGGTKSKVILVVGDSISAGYGLKRGTGWVALLEKKLQTAAPNYRVVNASISGETTAGGLGRLHALLQKNQPAVVVIQLGGNDGLRGLPLESTQKNLELMIALCHTAKAKVVLAGMQLPPNYSSSYASEFQAIYTRVAQETKVALIPFILEGITDPAQMPTLFQSDRLHPSEQAQGMILDNVWPTLEKVIKTRH